MLIYCSFVSAMSADVEINNTFELITNLESARLAETPDSEELESINMSIAAFSSINYPERALAAYEDIVSINAQNYVASQSINYVSVWNQALTLQSTPALTIESAEPYIVNDCRFELPCICDSPSGLGRAIVHGAYYESKMQILLDAQVISPTINLFSCNVPVFPYTHLYDGSEINYNSDEAFSTIDDTSINATLRASKTSASSPIDMSKYEYTGNRARNSAYFISINFGEDDNIRVDPVFNNVPIDVQPFNPTSWPIRKV